MNTIYSLVKYFAFYVSFQLFSFFSSRFPLYLSVDLPFISNTSLHILTFYYSLFNELIKRPAFLSLRILNCQHTHRIIYACACTPLAQKPTSRRISKQNVHTLEKTCLCFYPAATHRSILYFPASKTCQFPRCTSILFWIAQVMGIGVCYGYASKKLKKNNIFLPIPGKQRNI